jgi:hypothetical protein
MRRILLCIAASVAGLAGEYLIAAFIAADFGWLRGLWSWDRTDRAMLLYVTVICGGAPAVFTALFTHPIRRIA